MRVNANGVERRGIALFFRLLNLREVLELERLAVFEILSKSDVVGDDGKRVL